MTEMTKIQVGRWPNSIAFDGTNIWVASDDIHNNVTKILASTGAVVGTYEVGEGATTGSGPTGITFDGTNIWVTSYSENNVTKLLASTGALVGTYSIDKGVICQALGPLCDGTHIWVSQPNQGTVTKFLASTGAIVGTYPAGNSTRDMAFDGTNIWVVNYSDGVTKLLASTGAVVGSYQVKGAYRIVFDGTHIWVTNYSGGLTKLLASTGAVVGSYPVSGSGGMVFDGTHIWAAGYSYGDSKLTKLLASTGEVVGAPIPMEGQPGAVAFDGTNIWVTTHSDNTVTKIKVSDEVPKLDPLQQIEHVVLLMMENRSFDSLLGWLYEKGAPAKNIPGLQRGERPYEGLYGLNLDAFENVDATGRIKIKPIRGATGLGVPNVAPGENFTQVATQLLEWPFEMKFVPPSQFAPPIQMTPGGVLVAGKWRTTDVVKTMTDSQIRDALIAALADNTSQDKKYFSQFTDARVKAGPADKDLPGKGAVVVFLRDAGIRDVAWLKANTDDNQRNTLIVWLAKTFSVTVPELQGMTNQELVLMAWTRSKTPTMKGYVRDYTNELRHLGFPEDKVERYASQVMQSYTPDQLPVLNGLAEHYAVSDMWFSSVPSQTNPNRAFALCGTSMGLVNNGFLEKDERAGFIEEKAEFLIGDDRFEARTIFNALEESKATWKIFYQNGYLPSNMYNAIQAAETASFGAALLNPLVALGSIIINAVGAKYAQYLKELSSSELVSDYTHRLFPEILKTANADSHFAKLDEFHNLARAGQLPHFSYLQPEWTIAHGGTGGGFGTTLGIKSVLFHQGRDYHPPGNLDAAENLIKGIYNSLIANRKAWEKTLLIITFDEPVGSFDHIPPPAAIPPWGEGPAPVKREYNFDFRRYGGRVPAILVSPWVEKGTVFRSKTKVPFDHTSLIATILKWRGLEKRTPEFGSRTANAPTFDDVVSLKTPRSDEKDVRFFKSHEVGQPVSFHDRFYLKDHSGKYIAGFKEHYVMPGSIASYDPTITEYFPTLDSLQSNAPRTQFYFQNADNRPDAGFINADGGKTRLRLVATDEELGSYNVLGAWKDSTDVYYFNDYMEGDNSERETWTLVKASPGPLLFGDRVRIQNMFDFGLTGGGSEQRLVPCFDHPGYLTTIKSGHGSLPSWNYRIYPEDEYLWTVEPIEKA